MVFDTNCIVDLEERRPAATSLDALVAAWRVGKIDLAVTAVTASENQPGGGILCNFSEFEARLSRLGLADVHVLCPLATWDVGYFDHALWSSDDLEALAEKLRGILFPDEAPGDGSQGVGVAAKWRNHHCDVMVAWCCIHHGWDHLITRETLIYSDNTG